MQNEHGQTELEYVRNILRSAEYILEPKGGEYSAARLYIGAALKALPKE